MKLQTTTIAAAMLAMLAALCWWPEDASAGCVACPPGLTCVYPEGDYHRGFCARVVPAKEKMGAGQTCLCENDGSLRDEVKLYPCPCILPLEEWWNWDWELLGEHPQSLEPDAVFELLNKQGDHMKIDSGRGFAEFESSVEDVRKLRQSD